MTRRELLDAYRRMEVADGTRFRRWLATNSVIASAFAAALAAIILFNSYGGSRPHDTTSRQVATAVR